MYPILFYFCQVAIQVVSGRGASRQWVSGPAYYQRRKHRTRHGLDIHHMSITYPPPPLSRLTIVSPVTVSAWDALTVDQYSGSRLAQRKCIIVNLVLVCMSKSNEYVYYNYVVGQVHPLPPIRCPIVTKVFHTNGQNLTSNVSFHFKFGLI